MAISGQQRKCAITVASAFVSGTSHTDFPVLLTAASLPAEMLNTSSSYPAQSDGGDIRFSSDSAGTAELAFEIVDFTPTAGGTGATAEIWVKVPTLSGSSNTTIYVWYNTSGTTSGYAVGDTYGRNAVWSDYTAVWHMEGSGSPVDATGNGINVNHTYGSPTDASGAFGGASGAFDFDGNDAFRGDDTNALSLLTSSSSPNFALSAWAYPDTEQAGTVFDKRDEWAMQFDNFVASNGLLAPRINTWGSNNTASVSEAISINQWSQVVAYFDPGTSLTAFVNGSQSGGIHATGDLSANSSTYWWIGSYDNTSGAPAGAFFAGKLDEIRIRTGSIANYTSDWIATEYNNQNSPSTFASAGTPEDVGASGPTINSITVDPIGQTTATATVAVTI